MWALPTNILEFRVSVSFFAAQLVGRASCSAHKFLQYPRLIHW